MERQQRLQMEGINRNFNADDYEMLLELDNYNDPQEDLGLTQDTINRLPLHTLTEACINNITENNRIIKSATNLIFFLNTTIPYS